MPSSLVRDMSRWIAEHDPLPVVRWSDPLVETLGYDARSRYVETYWTPAMGPSAIALVRRLNDGLAVGPDGLLVPLGELGLAIGLGGSVHASSRLVLSLARIADFGFAVLDGQRYAIRSALPPLSRRQVARLPQSLAVAHDAELDDRHRGEQPPTADELEQAKALHPSSSAGRPSLSLCECIGRPS